MVYRKRLRRLEDKKQPQQGQLPIVVSDDTPASELLRLRQQNPGRQVFRFTDSVDLFL
ncbi:MAG: hypothetical protein RLZ25_2387 [Pseudomonadota bacterium]|jgi:hypothetical protein